MEKKIGEKFEFRGVMLEVVEDYGDTCEKCFARKIGKGKKWCAILPNCCSVDRKDRKSVAFIEVTQPQTFADAYDALIEQAERVAKLEQTPEQQAVSNATVDRLIASRNSLSPIQATLHVEDYGEYTGTDAPTMVSEE